MGAALSISVALWCSTAIPKTSGKKVKEGQEHLHAARVALRSLFSTLQAELTDIQNDLAMVGNALGPIPPSTSRAMIIELREQTLSTLNEVHAKHLQVLRE